MDKKRPETKAPTQQNIPPMPGGIMNEASAPEVDVENPIMPPEGFVAVPVDPPKKKRTALIVSLLSLAIVLIIGIAAAVWYFVYYSNPNKVAYDAVNGFLQREAVETTGLITGRTTLGSNNGFLFSINIESKNGTGVSGENTAVLKLTPVDANGQGLSDGNYEVEFSVIMLSDGVFYVKADRLAEAIETLADEMDLSTAEELEIYESILGLLEEVDGEWWRISIPELIDEYIDSSELARSSKEFYACLMNVANTNYNSQIAELYSNNQFINITKDSPKIYHGDAAGYSVSFDYDKMANFLNSTLDLEIAANTGNCFERFITDGLGSDGVNITFTETETDAETLRSMLDGVDITLFITDFGHELRHVDIAYNSNSDSDYVNMSLSFAYPNITIAPPSKYRPFDDLVELIGVTIMDLADIDIDSFYDEEWDITIDDDTSNEDFWA